VARLMREWGMKARTYRIYRRLLTRRALLRAWPNYRLATEKPISLNQHWSSDVTYIKMGRKNVFLAVVTCPQSLIQLLPSNVRYF